MAKLARITRTVAALSAVLVVSLGGFWVCDRVSRNETLAGALLLALFIVLLFMPDGSERE